MANNEVRIDLVSGLGKALIAGAKLERTTRTTATLRFATREQRVKPGRDEKVLTMEEAIRKMTSANAAKVHQYDRGLLRPGLAADVTVFNPATIIDNATYEKPHQYAIGVEYVVVNGKIELDRGKHTGARPGTILYGAGKL